MSPLVIQEAYAARVPVLASDVLGNAEQISHNQNGLLFHFNSVVSLKEQLMRCIDEPGLLIEMKSKLPAPVFFDKTANTYFTIYQTLLGSFT
jgi:glycosyltransferase involved in cell wall biosynthesis